MAKTRLVVTGGSGFIGTEVVKRAQQLGFEIKNLDFKPPHLIEHQSFWANVDVRDPGHVESEILSFDPNLIVHLASDVTVTLKTLDEYRTTTFGTSNVITAAGKLTSLRRILHVSTQFVVKPGITPKSETHFEPYTLYGEAKAFSEKLVRQSTLPWLIVRPTIIWGPRHPSFHQQIWAYIASRAYLHPYSSKPIMRCYGYVGNTADQILALLDANPQQRRVFYLGDSVLNYDTWVDSFAQALTGKKARRIPDWLLYPLAGLGSGINRLGFSAPIDLGRYFRMTTSSAIDLTPTFEVVGKPTISFEDGVRETIKWLQGIYGKEYV
jgi:nucleoside-diphosphate-sugar epimerase